MHVCLFYAVGNDLTGNTNLITHYNLEHAYNKFCGKKVKEKLSNFLPELPGEMDKVQWCVCRGNVGLLLKHTKG